ncbi:O-antigen polymerase [Lacinutrix chionoecetis]
MLKLKNLNSISFIASVFLGFIIWALTFFLLPISTNGISTKTITFIALSVVALFAGFYSFGNSTTYIAKSKSIKLKKYFLLLIIFAFIGLLCRYFELFFYRNLSFSNTYQINKQLSLESAIKAPLWLKSFATLRVLNTVPLILLIVLKSKNIKYWLLALFILCMSGLEVFIFGTRKPYFHLFILIVIAVLIAYNLKRITTYKSILITLITLIILGLFSYFILNKRMEGQDNKALISITESRYNDFVKIDKNKMDYFYKNPNSVNTKIQLLLIHTGQYFVHGFYELDHIINKDLTRAGGLYTFNPVFKLTNRLGFTAVNMNRNKFHPRGYVYVTFFGSLFIDFGWYSLIVIFLFGALQKSIYLQSKKHPVFKAFWVYLLSVNLVMPIFNLLSGSQLYLFAYLTILGLLILIIERINARKNIT